MSYTNERENGVEDEREGIRNKKLSDKSEKGKGIIHVKL